MSLDFRTLITRLIPLVEQCGNATIEPNFERRTLTYCIEGARRMESYTSLREMYECLLLIYQVFQDDLNMSDEERLRERKEAFERWPQTEKLAWQQAMNRHDIPKCIYYTEKVLRDTAHHRYEDLCQKLGA